MLEYSSRRLFLKTAALAGASLALAPWLSACVDDNGAVSDNFSQDLLPDDHWDMLLRVQDILMPSDEYGPGAHDIYAERYFVWLMREGRLYAKDIETALGGFDALNETSRQVHGADFVELERAAQEEVVAAHTNNRMGDWWLGRILTWCYEAMYAHPVYGSNPNKVGYEWIGYVHGVPEPTAETRYPEILKLIHGN
jgi:hypothetical protein